ncbi:MAG: helix-turn-helix transcriptional regulator [Sedimentisphaerales bacterium]|nr:helix-turn-helix transcriptional regulator [Sedimentisphaerales bacterium]MBN2844058.1 helix-turn-helix transcriptional regulator [Sedimentisphaerales bacterium]
MENTQEILDALKEITCGKGINEVFFSGNKITPPLYAFAVHFPRLTVILDGDYQTELEQGNAVTNVTIRPQQALFIPSNCWDKPNMEVKSRALHFLFGKRHTGISLVTTDKIVTAEKIALQHALAGPEQKILDAISELSRMKRPYPGFNHLINALLQCYQIKLEDHINKPASDSANLLFQEICVYIQENFQSEISRDSVAAHYDISPNHLSRLFRKNGYMKFCDYVNYVRINRAKFLLQNYDMPLYEIAKRCGYSDVVYFCRIFKKITKKTSKQYRSQIQYDQNSK